MSIKWENALKGIPVDGVAPIDIHGHLGSPGTFYNSGDGMGKQIVNLLDRIGAEAIIVSSLDALNFDFARGNEQVRAAAEEHPGRIFGYVAINPNYPEYIEAEIQKYINTPGFKGLKLHPGFSSASVTSAGYENALRIADERKLPVLVHTWGIGDALSVVRLADEYKNASFIIAHAEVALRDIGKLSEAVNARENVYVDTVISTAPAGGIETLVKYINPKKILYGTDCGFYTPSFTFGRIALSDTDDDVKLDILRRNAEELFGF